MFFTVRQANNHSDLGIPQLTKTAASPFHFNWTDAKSELLDPAIVGTTSILKAIKKSAPGVKRVVVTSSLVSVISVAGLHEPGKVFDESDWNPLTYEDGLSGDKGTAYRVSKTVAERSAWKFVEDEKPNFDLVTICPPLIFGPIVHRLSSLAAVNTSNERFVEMIQGKWKERILPSIGINCFVDVRDVAYAHIAAFENKAAGGKRFLCTSGKFCNREIVAAARDGFPNLGDKIPGENVEGGEYPAVVPGFDNSKATEILGISWIDIEKCTVDTVNSLTAVGA